jgi:putative transposase
LGGRGRYHGPDERTMIVADIATAVAAGARRAAACVLVGLSVRTVERWRGAYPTDARHGPNHVPANKYSDAERRAICATVTALAYRDLSPHQIVPRLADQGVYLASESTMYRVLRAEALLTRRGRAKAPVARLVTAQIAHGPNQVWSWDITYLPTPVRGVFLYLYLILDVWSRKIVGAHVYDTERAEHAAALFTRTCQRAMLDPRGLVLHADNGGPMKASTMVVTLERLGVLPSFSRPGVSNDNPFSEALFRTLKYCPAYPSKPFTDLAAATAWVAHFVHWYNHVHQHSAIRFVTPEERHTGREPTILAARQQVYERAREKRPDRWSGATRNWTPVTTVRNPTKGDLVAQARAAA